MESCIIIDKIMMNYIDFETGSIAYSNEYVELNNCALLDYYHSKIEKTLCNENVKRVDNVRKEVFDLLKYASKENEEFDIYAKTITDELANLGSKITDMPNSNIMFTKFIMNGEPYFGIIKLNFKDMPKMVTKTSEDKKSILLANKQQFNTSPSKADEAVFFKIDSEEVYLIEKKFKIDDKPSFYLNEFWLKGEKRYSDKEKLENLHKVLNTINKIYNIFDEDPLLLLRRYISNFDGFYMFDALEDVLEDNLEDTVNFDAIKEEAKKLLESCGFKNEDMIFYYKDPSVTKLKTRDDIEIKANNLDFLDNQKIEIKGNNEGTYDITIKNVEGYFFK